MPNYEEYRASATHAVADAAAARPRRAYTIKVRFLGGLTQPQRNAFKAAADRWTRVIAGDLPSVMVDGERIDDLLILAQGRQIDGVGKTLGQAGPTDLRPTTAGAASLLPAKGIMYFDTADLADMEQDGTLADVVAHEMGHVIGVGTIWEDKNLLSGAGSRNPTFVGAAAMAEYGTLRGGTPKPVPVEGSGGAGTRDSHWRETLFRHELMSGWVETPNNALSRLTVASLKDLGYVVDLAAAERYSLANLADLAERGDLLPIHHGVMLPCIPKVLPEDSIVT
jgi:hypothetical protein